MAQTKSVINDTDYRDELASLLKINKIEGWKSELFVHQNKIKDYLCHKCNGICCNAVELACNIDHDDYDIYPYCNTWHSLNTLAQLRKSQRI